ncbi:hypothetical protein ACOMCU_00650 [Lysinibacillus sp. UGB7]|uniref:hypothetical protein n=1 Tax=Lysinibacillus sp. UGB7 TaxID=3411039 RepID=UPI003B7B85B1
MNSKLKLAILLSISSSILLGCVESYQYKDVKGVVMAKEHDPAGYTTKTKIDSEGNTVKKKVYEAEEFEVIIAYGDIEKEFEFEDDRFYNKISIGGEVPLVLEQGLDAEGKIVTQDIELKEKNIGEK